jgi:hypothetical protein
LFRAIVLGLLLRNQKQITANIFAAIFSVWAQPLEVLLWNDLFVCRLAPSASLRVRMLCSAKNRRHRPERLSRRHRGCGQAAQGLAMEGCFSWMEASH